jgi:hypothetical protein
MSGKEVVVVGGSTVVVVATASDVVVVATAADVVVGVASSFPDVSEADEQAVATIAMVAIRTDTRFIVVTPQSMADPRSTASLIVDTLSAPACDFVLLAVGCTCVIPVRYLDDVSHFPQETGKYYGPQRHRHCRTSRSGT